MKRVVLLVVFAATFAVAANAQRYDGGRREYVPSPNRGRAYYTPRQKPLDCRKITTKNRAACEAAAAEFAARQQAAERQACLADLATSSWRLLNGSDRFTFTVTDSGQPLAICGEQVTLRPLQTIRIFPPDGQIGGKTFGAGASGERVELTARIRPVNQPGFIGFVLMAPGAPEGGN